MATATKTKKKSIRPLNDMIVIEPAKSEAQTSAGIVLPESAQEKQLRGTVVAAGPGRVNSDGERVAPQVKKGDVVIYSQYAGTEVELDGATYIVLGEGELLAKIEK
ncbi:MAG: co-chaperone GroES [Phycisphaera sp.]|nr:co-chaperone GroES [Phycisphaera sp.]